MLKSLRLTNAGPAPTMELDFGRRLNLLTGDSGLGKSFLLDIAWRSLTRKWPAEVNPRLTTGKAALPSAPAEAKIGFSFTGKTTTESYESSYSRHAQAWTGRAGRPANPGLVLYAMSDGSFAIWDPSRNYWRNRDGVDVQERRPAYVFDHFLIDEIESHLHPTWQRSVVPAVLSAMQELNPEAEVQLVAATHSPLIMASIEPEFDDVTDAWFDLDFEEEGVVLRRRDFEKRGDAATWLISEAFDLPSGRPLEYERLVDEAQALLNRRDPDIDQIKLMNDKLLAALNAKDYFLLNWRYICRQKGWLT